MCDTSAIPTVPAAPIAFIQHAVEVVVGLGIDRAFCQWLDAAELNLRADYRRVRTWV